MADRCRTCHARVLRVRMSSGRLVVCNPEPTETGAVSCQLAEAGPPNFRTVQGQGGYLVTDSHPPLAGYVRLAGHVCNL